MVVDNSLYYTVDGNSHGSGVNDTKGGAVAVSCRVHDSAVLLWDAIHAPHEREETDDEVNGPCSSV